MRRHSHAPIEPSSSYGSAGEYAAWQAVLKAFREDDLEEAYTAAAELGAGTLGTGLFIYRMIEAERSTRSQASTQTVGEGITLETVPDEVGDRVALARVVQSALVETAAELHLVRRRPVWITILAEAANTPWTPGRHGFCAAKTGFAKVCLPYELLSDPSELRAALKHEFSHALALETASGACPVWLDEAIAMAVGGGLPADAARRFRSGSLLWLPEGRLEAAFQADRESEAGRRTVTTAYWQSGVIGAYLTRRDGLPGLGRLLAAHAASPMERLAAAFRSRRPVDAALAKVYGLTVAQLFDVAHAG